MKRGHVALLVLSGLSCLVLLTLISVVHADYRSMKAKADAKAELLTDLRERQQADRRRLAVLESGEGREQLLLDNGYVRPGDRILLFPKTRGERHAAAKSQDALAPDAPAVMGEADNQPSVSAWRRAGAVFGGWWRTMQTAAGLQPRETHCENGD